MSEQDKILSDITSKEYEYGFVTDIETHTLPKGLSEDIVRQISALKEEPEWMLEYRLAAYRKWLTMPVPEWAHLNIPAIDFHKDIIYPLKMPILSILPVITNRHPDILHSFNSLPKTWIVP